MFNKKIYILMPLYDQRYASESFRWWEDLQATGYVVLQHRNDLGVAVNHTLAHQLWYHERDLDHFRIVVLSGATAPHYGPLPGTSSLRRHHNDDELMEKCEKWVVASSDSYPDMVKWWRSLLLAMKDFDASAADLGSITRYPSNDVEWGVTLRAAANYSRSLEDDFDVEHRVPSITGPNSNSAADFDAAGDVLRVALTLWRSGEWYVRPERDSGVQVAYITSPWARFPRRQRRAWWLSTPLEPSVGPTDVAQAMSDPAARSKLFACILPFPTLTPPQCVSLGRMGGDEKWHVKFGEPSEPLSRYGKRDFVIRLPFAGAECFLTPAQQQKYARLPADGVGDADIWTMALADAKDGGTSATSFTRGAVRVLTAIAARPRSRAVGNAAAGVSDTTSGTAASPDATVLHVLVDSDPGGLLFNGHVASDAASSHLCEAVALVAQAINLLTRQRRAAEAAKSNSVKITSAVERLKDSVVSFFRGPAA